MTRLVTIFGGSGFVGRYIARRMAQEGWRVRVAVRRPNEAIFVRPYGVVGQVEPVFCNIRDDDSVRAVTRGADAVVNCVGVLNEIGANKFAAVQAEGAARIAAEQGVEQMVHISSIGADRNSPSRYAQTKAAGEEGVLAHFPRAVILRPSVIFGQEDGFFNRFAGMAQATPILPLVGGNTRFQPVYVDDIARAAVMGIKGEAEPGIYELGGPEVATLRDLIGRMLRLIRRRRIVVNLPFFIGSIIGGVLDFLQIISMRLFTNSVLTRDQVQSLRRDNVVADGARGFAELGIEPLPMEAVIGDYLWRYRPSGQYAAIKDSAQNLRGH